MTKTMNNGRNIKNDDFKWNALKNFQNTEFNKIKVGGQTIRDDVFANIDASSSFSSKRMDKDRIYKAIEKHDYQYLRGLSNFFYNSNGIYKRLCEYMAYFFRYDWFITPVRYDDKIKDVKVIEGWYKSCTFLENSKLKQVLPEIALKVLVQGQYCGYKLIQKDKAFLQELPLDYCRSRFKHNGSPVLEFNVKFFDDEFKDSEQRLKVLKMFPDEFRKAYMKYKKGTLPKDSSRDDAGWVLLTPENTVKFNLGGSDVPTFINIIPHLLDLKDMQELDKKRVEQQILKIVIQKFPIDKNGDFVFDLSEVQQLHNNAVMMLGNAIGVDVLSTFADVEVADLSDRNKAGNNDELKKAERGVYNEAGISQMLFNTEGNLALEKSLANNESTMLNLLTQFEGYVQSLLGIYNKNPKRLKYQVQFLRTTGYNYKDLAKLYKEQTMLGFSRLLPPVALGQLQSSVIANAIFENEILKVNDLFIPPQMSSTMSGKDDKKETINKETEASGGEAGGRPTLPDDQKSEKTIRNEESL